MVNQSKCVLLSMNNQSKVVLLSMINQSKVVLLNMANQSKVVLLNMWPKGILIRGASHLKKKKIHQLSENNCETPEATFLSPDLRHFEDIYHLK